MPESPKCLGHNLPLSMSARLHDKRVLRAESTSLINFSILFEANLDYTRQMLKFVGLAPAWIYIQFIPSTNAAVNTYPRPPRSPIPLSPRWPINPNYLTQLKKSYKLKTKIRDRRREVKQANQYVVGEQIILTLSTAEAFTVHSISYLLPSVMSNAQYILKALCICVNVVLGEQRRKNCCEVIL